jgi:hypothetical protein
MVKVYKINYLFVNIILLVLAINISYGDVVVFSQHRNNLAEIYINGEPIGILNGYELITLPERIVEKGIKNISIVSVNKERTFTGHIFLNDKYIQLDESNLENGIWNLKKTKQEKAMDSFLGVETNILKLISQEIIQESTREVDDDSKHGKIVDYFYRNNPLKNKVRVNDFFVSDYDKGELVIKKGREFALIYCCKKEGGLLPLLEMSSKKGELTFYISFFLFRYDKKQLFFCKKNMNELLVESILSKPKELPKISK